MKKIKKEIYGKAQIIKAISPAGLGEIALDEIKSILDNLWFPQKFTSMFSRTKNEIRIDNIHLSAITELLMRSQCLTDIRLVIFEGKANSKFSFEKKCRSVNWSYFLNKQMSPKIKVNCAVTKTYNSTLLKKSLTEILLEFVDKIVHGENSKETTTIYADFNQDKLILSISLAGNKLYKRGYRGILSASAPLSEDAASCCIRKSLQFSKKLNKEFSPDILIIPFSGTGTFAFEYLQFYFNFFPVLFEREYALQKMSFFRKESFNYLLKKAREKCLFPTSTTAINHTIHFICIDSSKNAIHALIDNMATFEKFVTKNNFLLPVELSHFNSDFFKWDITENFPKNVGNVYLLLNPPYGIRFAKSADRVILYKNIARKVNELAKVTKQSKKNLLGFILCPSEETWSSFCKNLTQAKVETYHFTQGGIDIRVCQFFYDRVA
jgi:23S rRNA G2445 N2-methylase RlmL